MIRGGGSVHCADFISCLPLPPTTAFAFLITVIIFYSHYFIYYCVYFLIVFIVLLRLLSYYIYCLIAFIYRKETFNVDC